MALVIDELRVANWQRSGGKGQAPKPMWRPSTRDSKRDAAIAAWKARHKPDD